MAPNRKNSDTLSPFDFTDYRAYLRAYYQFKKENQKGFSYRSFARIAGFKSPNVLKLVIDGKRNIGDETIEIYAKALGLVGPMATYFMAMVRMNQSTRDTERQQHLEAMLAVLPHRKRRNLNPEALEYLSVWLHPVLREMVSLSDFREDPYWISRKLGAKVSLGEISKSLAFLLDSGFIGRGPDGKLLPQDHMVLSSDEVRSLGIRNYHRQMLQQAEYSLENTAIDRREYGAITFVLPDTAMTELKHRLKAFRRDLHEWATAVGGASEDNDTVVQVNFQMYPHT